MLTDDKSLQPWSDEVLIEVDLISMFKSYRCFVLTHLLRLPSMSAWLLRVRTPCLYVAALSRSGIAMNGLFPSVTLTTLLPPVSHWSSTSSDRLFLNSSSSLQIKEVRQSGFSLFRFSPIFQSNRDNKEMHCTLIQWLLTWPTPASHSL